MSAVEPSSALYLENRESIERAISAVCRRQRLKADEAEEFASDARFHLIKDDYVVLRAFKGRSQFSTFIFAVLSHLFQDWRNARWGKWRPSAEAKRQGPVATRLETLLVRDRFTLDEACEFLATDLGLRVTRSELEEMAGTFPRRSRRVFTVEAELVKRPAREPGPEVLLVQTEAGRARDYTFSVLERVVSELPSQDRLLTRMRFDDGLSVPEIARLLGREPKPLYRRLERVCATLRNALEREGMTRFDAVMALVSDDAGAEPLDEPVSRFAPGGSRDRSMSSPGAARRPR